MDVVHWKWKHPPCKTRHQCSCGIISQHKANFVFFLGEPNKTQDGLAHLQSCWWCSNSLLCEKQKTRRHCCQCLLASSWPSKYKCFIMPRCGGHCICGIHQPLGKMWIVHTLALEWPKCDYPLATRGIICKHVKKIFKMLHPNIGDGSIVRETNTLHGVVQFLNTIVLSAGLEMMALEMMIPMTNNLTKKLV